MKCHLTGANITQNYLEELLKQRGITDIESFLNPSEDALIPYNCLDNIQKGVSLLIDVLSKQGEILLIVDCDTDGVTSGAIMYNYIKLCKPDAKITFVMHEKKQHGLEDHIDNILNGDTHYDLIIQPDSGSNDLEYHKQLDEIGTKVLVLDHHLLEKEVAPNVVLVNNQTSIGYENKDLTGAGVAYQFCRAFDSAIEQNYSDELIDLAALGIIGDMGSMTSLENRYIVKKGLSDVKNKMFEQILNKQAYSITGKTSPSRQELLDKTTAISVAFYIVPLINAMIRVGTFEEKMRLFHAFIDGDALVPSNKRGAKGTYEKVCVESVRECVNAKSKQGRILDSVEESLEIKIHKYDLLSNKILFIRLDDKDDFPSEINGLVAMRCAAKYKKPTIIARLNKEGYDRGSIRGLNQSELVSFKAFLESSELFEYVQGHDNAAGCSILDKNLERFHQYANETLKDVDFGENYYDVDFERFAADTDITDIIFALNKYNDIYGQNNSEPLIYIKNINLTSNDYQVIGSKGDTLRFTKFGVTYIKFQAKDLIEQLSQHKEVQLEIVGTTNINEWMGNFTPQIMIKNYEVRDGSLCF